jgi:hypothetical protein
VLVVSPCTIAKYAGSPTLPGLKLRSARSAIKKENPKKKNAFDPIDVFFQLITPRGREFLINSGSGDKWEVILLVSKLLVIVATSDKEKALAALMYAGNALRRGWMDDVKVVFFGPSERLIVEDEEVSARAREISKAVGSFACKAISDRQEISGEIEDLGVKVEYVGTIVSDFIKSGYVPMVW